MATLPISKQITALMEREEFERDPAAKLALDLGCGSGIWTAFLAARGWEVTGIEIVPKALRAAQRRLAATGIRANLVRGNLAAIRAAGISGIFDFVLDLGAIHGLAEAHRQAAAREVTAVTNPESTMLLLAWRPARRGPLPRGMSRDEIEAAFAGWQIIDEEAADVREAPGFVQKAAPRFYRLRRG